MTEALTEVTAISTKGQVVIPKAIREALSLVTGQKLIIISDGDNILMKPIRQPKISEFSSLMDKAQEWAAEAGMSESDIDDAIKAVRRGRRAAK